MTGYSSPLLEPYTDREVGRIEYANAKLILPEPHPNPVELRAPLAEISREAGISLIATHVALDVAPYPFDAMPHQVGCLTLRLLIDERPDHSRTPRLEQFQWATYLAAQRLHTSKPKFNQLAEGYTQAVLGMASGWERDAEPLPATLYHQHAPSDGWHIQHGQFVYLGLLNEEVAPDTDSDPMFRGFDKYSGAKAAILTFRSTSGNVAALHEVANNVAKQYFYTLEGIRTHTGLRESISYIGTTALEAGDLDGELLFSDAGIKHVRKMFWILGGNKVSGVPIETLWQTAPFPSLGEPGPCSEEQVREALNKLFAVGYIDMGSDSSGDYIVRFSDPRMWDKYQSDRGNPGSLLNQLRMFRK